MVQKKTSPSRGGSRLNVLFGLLGAALIVGALFAFFTQSDAATTQASKTASVRSGDAPAGDIGGSYTLVDQDGNAVTEKSYFGKYVLMTFGFTYCPDICPTRLQDIALAVDSMAEDGKNIRVLFVSIDPQRDKPAQMKSYVGLYHNNIQGLTGTPEQVANIAQKFKVYYKRAEDTGDGNYMMDHSSQIYLLDPEGRFLEAFTDPIDPDRMAQDIKTQMHR